MTDRCTHSFPDPFPQPMTQPGDCRNCGISYQEAKATMIAPSDELRAASARLRELAKALHAPDLQDQSWHVEACANEEQGDCPCIVAQGTCNTEASFVQPLYYVADAETPECAAYIAAMGPPIGVALAKLLDLEETYLVGMPENERLAHVRAALAVARLINTGSKP